MKREKLSVFRSQVKKTLLKRRSKDVKSLKYPEKQLLMLIILGSTISTNSVSNLRVTFLVNVIWDTALSLLHLKTSKRLE